MNSLSLLIYLAEEVVKSETAGKALQALNNWLDEQLENGDYTATKESD